MSKEYGEYGVPGHDSTKRNIRQTLNGVRGLAGNNPIADVLEFRKEYTVVNVSQRNGRTGKRASEPATREPETNRPAPGLRSAWSRDAEPRVRVQYGRQSGELEVGSWPERIAPGRSASETAAAPPSMKDTIRAARAFFGSDPAD